MATVHVFGRDLREPKRYFDGTHRSRSPAETLAAVAPWMPRMGITRLADVTGLDHVGIPVFMAVRPNSRNVSVSQGKGLDRTAAKVSALMESLEGWHAEVCVRSLCYDSYRSLRRRSDVIDIEALGRMKGARLEPDYPTLWIEGDDLLNGRRTYVPLETVCMNFVNPPDYRPIFVRGTNGLASGNHVLEAISHAVSELIERDATVLWQLDADDARVKATQIDPATVDDAGCRTMLEKIARAELVVGMWDITSDSGVPAFACIIADRPGIGAFGLANGAGCHLDPGVALSRAISEAVQSRLTRIAGSRDDVRPSEYASSRNEDELREVCRQLAEPAPTRPFSARTSLATDSFEDDVGALLGALRGMGVKQVVAVDLTDPEIGVPVVKVVATGLEELPESGAEPGSRGSARARALATQTEER